MATVTVKPSSDWRPVPDAIKEKLKNDEAGQFLDFSLYAKGGSGSLCAIVFDEKHPVSSFDQFFAGVVRGATKRGLRELETQTRTDAPFPRTTTLFVRSAHGVGARVLLCYTFSADTVYIFTFVGDESLADSSPMFASYLNRISFSDRDALTTTRPQSPLEIAWHQGVVGGEILIVIVLLLAGCVIALLRHRRLAP